MENGWSAGFGHASWSVRAQSADEAFFEGFLWLGGLVAAGLVAVVILLGFRARLLRSTQRVDPLLSLAELRRLRNRGAFSIAEFEALRRRAVEVHKEGVHAAR